MKKFKFILKIFYGVLLGIALTVSIIFNVQSCNDRKTQTASADAMLPSQTSNNQLNPGFNVNITSISEKTYNLNINNSNYTYLVILDSTMILSNISVLNSSGRTVSVTPLFNGQVNSSSSVHVSAGYYRYKYVFYYSGVSGLTTIKFTPNANGYISCSCCDITSLSNFGYDAGYSAGYSAGNTAGYNSGYSAGVLDGVSDGYSRGYAEGLVAGVSADVDYAQYFADGFNDGFISKFGNANDASDYSAGYSQAELDVSSSLSSNVYDVGFNRGMLDKFFDLSFDVAYNSFSSAFDTAYSNGFNAGYDISNKYDDSNYVKARYDFSDLFDAGYTAGANIFFTPASDMRRAYLLGYYDYISSSSYKSYYDEGYIDGLEVDTSQLNSSFSSSSSSAGSSVGYDLGYQDGLSYGNGTGGIEVDIDAIFNEGKQAGIDYANSIVTITSASYQAGNSAGFTTGYNSGYTVGETSANETVTTTSASYTAGYSAGVASVDTQSYFDSGYLAGVTAANETVTTTSASYAAGVTAANNTVTTTSASYTAGYNAGVASVPADGGYDDGYAAGVTAANNTVTPTSASYAAGVTAANNTVTTTSASYTAGYNAGYDDGYDVGYDEGYDDGTAAGGGGGGGEPTEGSYEEGYADGVRDSYLFQEITIANASNLAPLNGTYVMENTQEQKYFNSYLEYDDTNNTIYINRGLVIAGGNYNVANGFILNLTQQLEPGKFYKINFSDLNLPHLSSDHVFINVLFMNTRGQLQFLQNVDLNGNLEADTLFTPNFPISQLYFYQDSFTQLGWSVTDLNVSSNTLSTVYDEAKSAGYDAGLKVGFNLGYDEAVSSGTNGSSLFFAAISFVRMFFTQAATLLALPIAGDITIGLIVIGIPAAFMLVDLVIKLVLGFLGRKAEATE